MSPRSIARVLMPAIATSTLACGPRPAAPERARPLASEEKGVAADRAASAKHSDAPQAPLMQSARAPADERAAADQAASAKHSDAPQAPLMQSPRAPADERTAADRAASAKHSDAPQTPPMQSARAPADERAAADRAASAKHSDAPPMTVTQSARSAEASGRPQPTAAAVNESDAQRTARARMVDTQILSRGVQSEAVIAAMRSVPRHEFVSETYRGSAYDDRPLPIEDGQTISQPYIVALMTELADLQPGEKVLEVGTGSGYQAAVLAALGARVYSVEIMPGLAASARARLQRLRYPAEVRHGDGYAGWPEEAPFDAIIITAAPPRVPEPLVQQLAVGGKLVVPVGRRDQDLWVWTRTEKGIEKRNVLSVRFVPMTGQAQH